MEFSKFKFGQDDISRRLDKVIRIFANNLSLPEIYKSIRKGLIRVNNHKSKSEYRIQENDEIEIATFLLNKTGLSGNDNQKNHNDFSNEKMPEIVFENENILIVNKPYDVNVHGDENSLDKVIQQYFDNKSHEKSLSFKPGPLHRLDKKTTGLLAFSKSLEGARWFSENIQNHNIKKKYYGLVNGKIVSEEIWQDVIIEDDESKGFHKVIAKKITKNNMSQVSLEGADKIAETVATPLAYGSYDNDPVTLVEFNIKTGRKHQIRAQSSLHNHSLLGDTAYGSEKLKFGSQDFYLTAKELIFPKDNPLNIPCDLVINLPDDFIKILKHCGIKKNGV